MGIEKGKISSSLLMFLVASFVMGSVFLISFMDSITHHDSWLVISSALVVSIPIALLYVALVRKFPGKNLIQINDIVYGRYIGKLISIQYISFFILLLFLNIRTLLDFYIGYIMPETPMLVFSVMFTLVCAYAVRKGIEVISRISFTVVIVIYLIVTTMILLLLKDMKFSNFLPVLEIPLKEYVHGIHLVLALPFCDIVVFLMVLPCLNSFKHSNRSFLFGLIIGALSLIFVSIRNTAVLGASSSILINASYQALRIIDIGNFLTRLELLVAIGITIAIFIKVCVIYYVSVYGIAQLLHLRSYSPLIFPVGGIAVIISVIIFDSAAENFEYATKYHLWLASFFEFVIPPITLLVSKMRKLPKPGGGST